MGYVMSSETPGGKRAARYEEGGLRGEIGRRAREWRSEKVRQEEAGGCATSRDLKWLVMPRLQLHYHPSRVSVQPS